MMVLKISTLCVSVLVASSIATMTATAGDPQAAKTAVAAAQETDPICGMSVDPTKAKDAKRTSEFEGKTFYFCSDTCKKQFDSDPAKFTAAVKSGEKPSGMQGCCCGGGHGMGMETGSTGMGMGKGMGRGMAAKPAGDATQPASGGMCCRRMK